MSDVQMTGRDPHRPFQSRRGRERAHRPISIENLPTAEDLAASPHKGDLLADPTTSHSGR